MRGVLKKTLESLDQSIPEMGDREKVDLFAKLADRVGFNPKEGGNNINVHVGLGVITKNAIEEIKAQEKDLWVSRPAITKDANGDPIVDVTPTESTKLTNESE